MTVIIGPAWPGRIIAAWMLALFVPRPVPPVTCGCWSPAVRPPVTGPVGPPPSSLTAGLSHAGGGAVFNMPPWPERIETWTITARF